MMVLAGPGSGKTTVITRRVAELIDTYGVKPENILVITFTKAAATEMKERFLRLPGRRNDQVNFGTFHAVFFKIIRYAYSYDSSHILSDEDRFAILKDSVLRLKLDVQDEKEFLGTISSEISSVKNSRMAIANYYSTSCAAEDFRKIYAEYEAALRRENKIDFEDMMLMCHELLCERPDILSFWQQRYRYVLIDEFQDINLLQYEIISMLAKPENNIFIVGDDDQAIYGFRGSKPQIMLGFAKDFPGTQEVSLGTNYRCSGDIIKAAGELISHNRSRFKKEIRGASEDEGTVRFLTFKNVDAQNEFVVKRILDLLKKGDTYSDMAVLYRMNSQPRSLVEKLSEYNLPYTMADKLPNLYDHWITRNMLAYMELASGSTARELWLEIANRPKRYIPRDFFASKDMTIRDLYRAAGDRDYIVKALDKLCYDLSMIARLDPFAAITYIRNVVGYDEYLRDYATYRHMDVEELLLTLGELQQAAKGYANVTDWKAYMADYKRELAQTNAPTDSVHLMTFHSSKGLEFKNVFIIDANEGYTPHSKAEVAEDIEEERRMFYVAMTRAAERLYVLSESERYGKPLEVSRFVAEAKGEE